MSFITLDAFSKGFLNFAARKVGHAVAFLGEVVISAEGTHSVGIDVALGVSQLALSEGAQEVQSIAVYANARLVEV